jgi:hypothetical protein
MKRQQDGVTMFDLSDIKIGNTITRTISESIDMSLPVTNITEDKIVFGDYEFDKETGMEIDELLGWDKYNSGSRINPLSAYMNKVVSI